jgi:hypothetical protein
MPGALVVAADMSFELLMKDLWNDCKAIVVGYSETARLLDPATLADLELRPGVARSLRLDSAHLPAHGSTSCF